MHVTAEDLAAERPFVLRLALRRTRDREEAEDLCQEALLRAIRHVDLAEHRDREQLRRWLVVVVRTAWIDLARQRRGASRARVDMPAPPDARSAEEVALAHLELEQVLADVAALPDEQREAVLGPVSGQPGGPPTERTRRHRARGALVRAAAEREAQ